MKNLKIFTAEHEKFNDKKRYKGTYLHGKMEQDYGYDIFSFERKQKFETGVHEIEINGKDCTFFLWRPDEFKGVYGWRGFLIYANDSEARKHALFNYNKKSCMI